MSEHTPAPWKPRPDIHWEKSDHGDYRWVVLMSSTGVPFQIAMVQVDEGDTEQEANLRLILKAPDLLAALERMVEQYRLLVASFPKEKQWPIEEESVVGEAIAVIKEVSA